MQREYPNQVFRLKNPLKKTKSHNLRACDSSNIATLPQIERVTAHKTDCQSFQLCSKIQND